MLTKNQFVKKLAKKTDTSVAVSKEIVNSFLETIQIGEKKGQKYTIPAHKEVKASVSKGFRKSYEEVEVKFE